MLEKVETHRLKCTEPDCHRELLLTVVKGQPVELPTHWEAHGKDGHTCPRCRAARGDFGPEAQARVTKLRRQS